MSQYALVMLWMMVIYLMSITLDIYKIEYVNEKKELRVSWFFAILFVIPLIWWTANRTQWFFDTGVYVRNFTSMPKSLSGMYAYVDSVNKDKGFSIVSILIKMFFGNNVIIYLGVIAAIQLMFLVSVYRKYSINYVMSIFLFVATTDYISWMHNGIRQFLAVMLIFAATELMIEKKYFSLILIVLLASTLHGSALLMIPIIFLVQGRPWNKKTMVAILIFLLAIIYVDNFTNILEEVLSDTQYTNVVSDWQQWEDNGTNPIRVLVYSIPTLLSLVGLRIIREADEPIINMACNMGIISTLLYCLSMVTSGIFIGRLPIYCSLYATGILLPWELENLFTKESAKIIKLLTVVGFLGFYFYQTHFIWGLI